MIPFRILLHSLIGNYWLYMDICARLHSNHLKWRSNCKQCWWILSLLFCLLGHAATNLAIFGTVFATKSVPEWTDISVQSVHESRTFCTVQPPHQTSCAQQTSWIFLLCFRSMKTNLTFKTQNINTNNLIIDTKYHDKQMFIFLFLCLLFWKVRVLNTFLKCKR